MKVNTSCYFEIHREIVLLSYGRTKTTSNEHRANR